MKTISDYTICCTPEQTKKAFELGAPLKFTEWYTDKSAYVGLKGEKYAIIPTAEQMLGWLRSKGFRFTIEELSDTRVLYRVVINYRRVYGQTSNPKKATLAAIDAALEYLSRDER